MTTGAARRSAPEPDPVAEQYAAAMKLFSQQKFDRAKPLLEKLCTAPHPAIADRARLHLRTCSLRLDKSGAAAADPEDRYHRAVVRLNAGQYDEAAQLLESALRDEARPHYHYAFACLKARSGEAEAAMAALRQAIAGDPRSRVQACADRDFEALMDDPRFTELLYPERG